MTDVDKINILLKEGEGLTVEFKERYTPKIDRDIVAFANSKGGLLLLGIDDRGKVVGEKLTNKMKAEINAIARNCDPSIHIKKIHQEGNIVVVEVAEGDEKPYGSSSGYYRRLDAVTQKMTQREVRSLFRETDNTSFEDIPCRDLSLKDISLMKVKSFLREANMSYKVSKANLASFLTSLSIYRKDKINNAGALMFSPKVKKFIPHAESIFASFKGTDKTNIYDRNDVKDDLLTQFNGAVAFLKKHLNVRSEIRGFDRFDIYEIPLDSLREAVVNAIVHRDYAVKGTSIYVRIFDDRVEIENPGGLPDGITKRDFGKSSVRRNPIIADMFHRMGKVERMGSGIERMRELMSEAGLKEPAFEMDAFFRVTFYRDPRYSLKAGEDITQKTTQKTTQKIIEAIVKKSDISQKELAELIGITDDGIKYHITRLRKKGILKRIGPDKGGHWEIVDG